MKAGSAKILILVPLIMLGTAMAYHFFNFPGILLMVAAGVAYSFLSNRNYGKKVGAQHSSADLTAKNTMANHVSENIA